MKERVCVCNREAAKVERVLAGREVRWGSAVKKVSKVRVVKVSSGEDSEGSKVRVKWSGDFDGVGVSV